MLPIVYRKCIVFECMAKIKKSKMIITQKNTNHWRKIGHVIFGCSHTNIVLPEPVLSTNHLRFVKMRPCATSSRLWFLLAIWVQFLVINIFYFISVLKFDFFIGVDMVMCHALICVKEMHRSLMAAQGFRVASLFSNATEIVQLSILTNMAEGTSAPSMK